MVKLCSSEIVNFINLEIAKLTLFEKHQKKDIKMIEALGIIETIGYTVAIAAADAAVKSANIKLGKTFSVGGGKVNLIIRGDVAAVKAAIEAGVQAASRVGTVESEIVIPRPSEKLTEKFDLDPLKVVKKTKK